jgi:thiaminase/transcriptional activator TenA
LHEHPFIQEVAKGTLPLAKFRFFLEQDLMYLPDYARCIAMGVVKSRSDTEMRYFAAELTATLETEIPNNQNLLARVVEMGAEDRGGGRMMAPANVAYTCYLTALGLRGDTLEITAALLPCAWSYMEIALALSDIRDQHPVYADWIGFYASEDYVSLIEKMRRDFDDMVASEDPSQARLAGLREIFGTSSRLERSFWSMSYSFEQWPDAGNR